ncbi:hypothetical protein Ctob_008099 [Chrysochromulina tobinii]|uniref:Uncharacterized protein n=1 Tax=Chrysochromulina tobinii TaxID=1460289 RepID=A0A0M0K2N7_9EUKA|nr:hypothetical protein Ctob_008099 [Chrysochromulina tobinii]|eukprot:KOO33069.1 hypothetical protein Ctob_008099 [Chrysochromulina sp. CCMP291]
MLLIDLPDELLVHCALQCVMHDHVISAQQLSHGCKHLHELFLLVRSDIASRRHTLRWIVPRLAGDVVLRGGGRGLRASSDGCWKRAYGRQLIPHGCSSWSVRIDRCKGSQGLLQIGVVLVQRTLTCEWSVSPFYGRLIRRTWDRDGTMLLGAVPPDGHPDGHLKHMLVDGQGEPVRLEGSANGRIIEVLCDHVAGTLAFALDGAPPGPALEGFPRLSDGGGALLRPVVAFRFLEDQVTVRSEPRFRDGWPQQDTTSLMRDARGQQAALALQQERPTLRVMQCVLSARAIRDGIRISDPVGIPGMVHS